MNEKAKKTLNIIKNILVWAIVLFAIGMMIFTVISVNTFDRNDRSFFGHKAYVVQSDSMAATHFDAGDVIFVKELTEAEKVELDEGDVIAFLSTNSDNYNQTVTHMISRKTTYNGEPAFITKGTTTGTEDETPVTYTYILGKYSFAVPGVGQFFLFLKQPQGYILCILIPFLLLIIYQGINCVRLFKKYKSEQLDELKEERAKIEEERKASLEMLKELQALKDELAAKKADENPPAQQADKELQALKELSSTMAADTETPLAEKSEEAAAEDADK